jgi:hypothetical protein
VTLTAIKVQSGPRNARTDPESGLRFYTWQGVEYPSVTSVRNLAGMPHKLANWRTNQVIERAMTEYPTLGTMLGSSTPEQVASWLRRAANEKRDKAAGVGTRVHDAAQSGMTLDKAPADIAPYLIQHKRWLEKSKVEVLLVERQVWSPSIGFAGTFDLIGRFPSTGQIMMIDLKTGAGTYPEHALQCEAYSRADFVGEDDVIDDEATAILRAVTGKAILHLSPTGWTFHVLDPKKADDSWFAFRGLLVFASWAHRYPEIGGLVLASATGGSTP